MRMKSSLSFSLYALFLLVLTWLIFPPSSSALEPAPQTHLNNFFRLYRFIPPEEILLFENRDMARKDIKQTIVSDTRTPAQGDACVVGTDTCKGVVTLRNEVAPGQFENQILPDSGVCRPGVNVADDGTKTKEDVGGQGYCDYRKKPTNYLEITTVDFSKGHILTFPKLQNSFYKYWYDGGSNDIGWGSHNLSVAYKEQYVRKAITLAQAAETTDTYDLKTGEWPLGGVNFDAPLTPDSKTTLIEVWRSLEADEDGKAVKLYAKILMGRWLAMIRPLDQEALSDALRDQAQKEAAKLKNTEDALYKLVAKNANLENPPKWVESFVQVPECGPGYDKGYVLASVCMLGNCTINTAKDSIGDYVKNPSFRDQTLYADPRIRQNLCAAVYDVYQKYPLKQAQDIIRKASKKNPLFQYSLRSDENATPLKVEKHLSELQTPLSEYKNFSLPWFHKVLDGWRKGGEGYWFEHFGLVIRQGLDPREADAIEPIGFLGVVLRTARAVSDQFIDFVFQALHHTVVIPPPAAHSIEALEEAIAETEDTSSSLKDANSASELYSNYVSAGGDAKLTSGIRTTSRISQRYMALYACSSKLFSSSWMTNVKDYVNNVRVSCFPSESNSGKLGMACNGATVSGSGSCKVCNLQNGGYMLNVGYSTVPKNLLDLVESSAQKYNVPGSIILGIMFAEGGFERASCYGSEWTDANVAEWSSCGTEIANCNTCNVSSAQAKGPYQIIVKWAQDLLGEKGSPCNLYDATEATAKALARGRYGYGSVWAEAGANVDGEYIRYNNPGTLPSSCGGWTKADVVTAARAHRGILDEQYFKRVLDFHKLYTCQ